MQKETLNPVVVVVMLKEERAQYAIETEVSHLAHLAVTELLLHVTQQHSALVVHCGSHTLHR